jgi:plasmid stability protein
MTIRQLDETTKRLIKQKAAKHNRSMEAEAREILRKGARAPDEDDEHLVTKIRRMVDEFGGVELKLPARTPMRKPPDFDE